MKCYIGIDSGGTKTEAILADACGNILRRCTDRGCNPMDTGVQTTRETILSCLERLLSGAGGEPASLYAGIAGANHVKLDLNRSISQKYGIPVVKIDDDRRITVSSTLGHADGCGLICGTGSSLSILREGQPVHQVGGLGYLIDTGGSGFELGQAALKQAFRCLDGRGPHTVLAELIREKLGKDPWDAFADIYAGGRAYIASFACTVFEGWKRGDGVCQRIVEEGAGALSELTFAAERYFEGNFPIVMTGGIFTAYPEYVELVKAGASKRADMLMAAAPPVYGALVEAYYQDGIRASAETRGNFQREYRRIRSSRTGGGAVSFQVPAGGFLREQE